MKQNINLSSQQSGFTLIELMISLVLGLLITAAAIQIYIVNVKTSTIQKSGSELQEASVFGLQMLENHIRLANLGNPNSAITDTSLNGGIVLSGLNIGQFEMDGSIKKPKYDNTGYLTRTAGQSGAGTNAWTGISNTDVGSDQLTIQFRNTTGTILADCEGNNIEKDATVIERFFLRPSASDTSTGAIKKLVLACDAGRIEFKDGQGTISDFGQLGQEFMVGVDQFKVLLGIQGTEENSATPSAVSGRANYVSSEVYDNLSTKPAINSIKIGLIVSGSTPIMGSNDRTIFNVLGVENSLKSDTTRQKLVRNTYETTVILRNARVMSRTSS